MTKKEQLKYWLIDLNESISRFWLWHFDRIFLFVVLLLLCVLTALIYWNLFKTKEGYDEIKKELIKYQKDAFARGESEDKVLSDIYFCWYYKYLFPDENNSNDGCIIK